MRWGWTARRWWRRRRAPAIQAEWAANNAAAVVARRLRQPDLFFLGDLWLWGQDRLFFLEKALAGEAVQTP